ncbi:MAG TPA: hypothetical protein ENK33_10985 [Desulfobacterales bacterium]|nr:hypothetical protein [Desulfobacterales bacterium]
MSKHILIIQQSANKIPGNILKIAAGLNIQTRIIKLWHKNMAIPSSLNKYDALVVLDAAPPPADHDNPLSPKCVQDVITKSLEDDRPFLGIGRGLHLLAAHYGAVIDDNFTPDIGFITGYLTHKGREHPIFNNLPDKFLLFKWHRQAVMSPTPANVDILASSVSCQFEALSITGRPHIVGLQFMNNSAALKDVKKHIINDKNWLSSHDQQALPTITDEAARLGSIATNHFNAIFSNFINMI